MYHRPPGIGPPTVTDIDLAYSQYSQSPVSSITSDNQYNHSQNVYTTVPYYLPDRSHLDSSTSLSRNIPFVLPRKLSISTSSDSNNCDSQTIITKQQPHMRTVPPPLRQSLGEMFVKRVSSQDERSCEMMDSAQNTSAAISSGSALKLAGSVLDNNIIEEKKKKNKDKKRSIKGFVRPFIRHCDDDIQNGGDEQPPSYSDMNELDQRNVVHQKSRATSISNMTNITFADIEDEQEEQSQIENNITRQTLETFHHDKLTNDDLKMNDNNIQPKRLSFKNELILYVKNIIPTRQKGAVYLKESKEDDEKLKKSCLKTYWKWILASIVIFLLLLSLGIIFYYSLRPYCDRQTSLENLYIYEINPFNFFDTNSDGIGDLNGVSQRLHYLKLHFNINAILLRCLGGFVCNNGPWVHEGIAPQLGDIETLNQLIEQANRMNIKTIIEIQLPLLQSTEIDDQYENLLNDALIPWIQVSSLFGIIIQTPPSHSLFRSDLHGSRLVQLVRSRFPHQHIITEFFASNSDYIDRRLSPSNIYQLKTYLNTILRYHIYSKTLWRLSSINDRINLNDARDYLKILYSLLSLMPGNGYILTYGDELEVTNENLIASTTTSSRTYLYRWNSEQWYGFSTVRPYIYDGGQGKTVIDVENDPDSLFNWLKRLSRVNIQLRCTCLSSSYLEFPSQNEMTSIVIKRVCPGQKTVWLVSNLNTYEYINEKLSSSREQANIILNSQLLPTSNDEYKLNSIRLMPRQTIIIEK
ncbi:unnamed protein product [Didymodactylos carnosus]|uniref:Glycosyl hydrolase family 13 catalytic domain-containing protein n=1 Tax=Didymodactylos carnosus TaxID=1234261 RepID=A0A814B1F3_9BILA|nr:unnamed protein product [Didymodactylos carnosus]CAF1081019.1 unnamed protein product [Didymodactylos carnosus]CAF3701985.1 unnamed protein product [Didymodactylos carnosus]CAF3843991.1 unnamed protein product [Didymodactylos carnosus]